MQNELLFLTNHLFSGIVTETENGLKPGDKLR